MTHFAVVAGLTALLWAVLAVPGLGRVLREWLYDRLADGVTHGRWSAVYALAALLWLAPPCLLACLLLGWWWGAGDVVVLLLIAARLSGTFSN